MPNLECKAAVKAFCAFGSLQLLHGAVHPAVAECTWKKYRSHAPAGSVSGHKQAKGGGIRKPGLSLVLVSPA